MRLVEAINYCGTYASTLKKERFSKKALKNFDPYKKRKSNSSKQTHIDRYVHTTKGFP